MHGAAAQRRVGPRPGPADGDPAAGAVAEEEWLLLPGYIFVGAEYTAALFHLVSPVPGVIRWLGLERGEPQALDTRDVLRWRLDDGETLEPSRVMFFPGGWHVLDGPLAAFAGGPVRMERRQRRAYVTAELGGVARRVRFGVIPVDGDAQ